MAAVLNDHHVEEARARGWDALKNGELLAAAEMAGFDVLVTTDRNIQYQQNLAGRKLAIVVLSKARWALIKLKLDTVRAAIIAARTGDFIEIDI